MTRLLSLALLLAVSAGCATSGTTADASLTGNLRLDAAALDANATIAENAMGQPELSTLVSAIQRLDLGGTLSGPGPFTVFAPINDAFDGVDLSSLSDQQLRDIVTYHVVPGDFSAADLSNGMTLETVNGNNLTISTETALDADLKVDDADIIYPNIEASNGTIHLINLVLNPIPGGTAR